MSSSALSKPLQGLIRLSLLGFVTLGLQACQTIPTSPKVEIPTLLKAPCKRPEGKEAVKTAGDLASYSIRQDAQLQICEAKRSALVMVLEAFDKPAKRWWEFR